MGNNGGGLDSSTAAQHQHKPGQNQGSAQVKEFPGGREKCVFWCHSRQIADLPQGSLVPAMDLDPDGKLRRPWAGMASAQMETQP